MWMAASRGRCSDHIVDGSLPLSWPKQTGRVAWRES
jgi:hypothetical protein